MWTRAQARGGKSPLSFFSAIPSGLPGKCSKVPSITILMGFALSMRNAMLSVIRDFISAAMAARPRHCVVWNRRRNAGRHQAHTERGCSQGCAAGSRNQGARLRGFFECGGCGSRQTLRASAPAAVSVVAPVVDVAVARRIEHQTHTDQVMY